MYKNCSVGVVVPAYNEERLIARTLSTMPDFVDTIIVVNDSSRDKTAEQIDQVARADARIVVLTHEVNKGLGQTLIDGYLKALDLELDIVAIMAGDAQMNPDDLHRVIDPIAEGLADYVKGNRLLREEVTDRMPTHRYIGNSALTLLTKFATGYWRVIDPQCGYTAISHEALSKIPIQSMIKGYGYNADVLNMLNLKNFRVVDVEVEPVYGEEVSGIKLSKYIPTVSWLLLRLFLKRLKSKYLVPEFHPLVFLYAFSAFNLLIVTTPYTLRLLYHWANTGIIDTTMLLFLLNVFSTGVFSLVLGMWLDMEDNRRLIGREKPHPPSTAATRRTEVRQVEEERLAANAGR